MPTIKDEITGQIDVRRAGPLHSTLVRMADLIQRPRLGLRITAAAQVSAARDITVQVTNRLNRDRPGRFPVLLWLSTTAAGDPGGTQTFGSISAGVVLATYTPNVAALLLTDEGGKITLPVSVVSPGSRWVRASILADTESAEVVWT